MGVTHFILGIRAVEINKLPFLGSREKPPLGVLLSTVRCFIGGCFFVLVGLATSHLSASQATPAIDMPLELSALGLPIIRAVLVDRNGTARAVRMVIDTGASISVLDASIPDEFWASFGKTSKGGTSTREIVEAREGEIYGLDIGPMRFRKVRAIRVDLSSSLSRSDDAPIDGVIGMNVLHGQRFQMDFSNHLIRWGSEPHGSSMTTSPISYDHFGDPLLEVCIGEKKLSVGLDTGSNEFLVVSPKDLHGVKILERQMKTGVASGLGDSTIIQGSIKLDGGVKLGDRLWPSPDVLQEDTRKALLGIGAMGPSIWFDFIRDTVTFTLDEDGSLPSTPTRHFPIAAYWNRRDADPPQLVVLAVKPGSPYEKVGILAGDVLIQVGDLKGKALTIRSLGDCLSKGTPLVVVIDRRGKRLELNPRPQMGN